MNRDDRYKWYTVRARLHNRNNMSTNDLYNLMTEDCDLMNYGNYELLCLNGVIDITLTVTEWCLARVIDRLCSDLEFIGILEDLIDIEMEN